MQKSREGPAAQKALRLGRSIQKDRESFIDRKRQRGTCNPKGIKLEGPKRLLPCYPFVPAALQISYGLIEALSDRLWPSKPCRPVHVTPGHYILP